MTGKSDITRLFDSIRVCRDTFRQQYEVASVLHKKKVKDLQENYRKKLLTDELQKEKTRYQNELERSRKEAADFIFPQIEKIKKEAVQKVEALPDSRFQILLRMSELPVTREELAILKEKYQDGTAGEYWNLRVLQEMSEKNGISGIEFPPSIDSQIQILSNLKKNLQEYFDGYCGSDTPYMVRNNISDHTLLKMEKIYTDDFRKIELTPEQTAQRLASMITAEPDAFRAGIKLRNSLERLDEWTKTLFFDFFEKNGGRKDILYFANCEESEKDFIKHKKYELQKSREFLADVSKMETSESAAAFLDSLPDGTARKYFTNFLRESIKENEILRDACKKSEIPEFEKLAVTE